MALKLAAFKTANNVWTQGNFDDGHGSIPCSKQNYDTSHQRRAEDWLTVHSRSADGSQTTFGVLAKHELNATDQAKTLLAMLDAPAVRRTSVRSIVTEGEEPAVRAPLVSHGNDGAHITAQGTGEAVPVVSKDTGKGRQRNRRPNLLAANASYDSLRIARRAHA